MLNYFGKFINYVKNKKDPKKAILLAKLKAKAIDYKPEVLNRFRTYLWNFYNFHQSAIEEAKPIFYQLTDSPEDTIYGIELKGSKFLFDIEKEDSIVLFLAVKGSENVGLHMIDDDIEEQLSNHLNQWTNFFTLMM